MRKSTHNLDAALEAECLDGFLKIKPADPPAVCERIVKAYNPKHRVFMKQCYPRAFLHILHLAIDALRLRNDSERETALRVLEETWLVHGQCLLGGLGGHAWVELPGEVVFDGVYQRFCKKRSYYRTQFAIAYQKFRPRAAFMLLQHLLQPIPNLADPMAEIDPSALYQHIMRTDKVRFSWCSVWGFPVAPAKPVLVNEKMAAKLIEARFKRKAGPEGKAVE